MDFIWESITEWLKEVLIGGIVSNLSGVFDSTNEQVSNIVGQVGMTPQAWNGGIFKDFNKSAGGRGINPGTPEN